MSKKVLLVEDFPVLQDLYGKVLKGHYYNVDVAADGSQALEKVKKKEYDFILLDLLLPNLNGIEFLEQFKDRPEHTKVVVLSDFNEPKTVERAHQLGIAAYYMKAETTPSELIEKLNKMDDNPNSQESDKG